jgi:hypothetical protein
LRIQPWSFFVVSVLSVPVRRVIRYIDGRDYGCMPVSLPFPPIRCASLKGPT